MSDEHPSPDGAPGVGPLEVELADLRRRVGAARSERPVDVDVVVADLETAYEELRVADDQLRAQLEQLEQLSRGARRLRGQHGRLLAALPVATLTTDERGVILSANAAAAHLASTPAEQLVGKPVLALFTLEDRRALRSRISGQLRDGEVFRQRATILERDGGGFAVEITAAVLPGPVPEASWVLFEDGAEPTTTPARRVLPDVLVRLAALPSSTTTVHELLTRAAVLCRAALGDDIDLSISVGSPSRPDALASTAPVAQQVDGVQLRHDAGPCVEAYRTRRTVVTDDLRTDPRWPGIVGELPDTVGAVVAAVLADGDASVGALNVYRSTTGADAALVQTVELLAATLSSLLRELALASELRATAADMERALTSRAVIDQAKGIVMAERRCTAGEAFEHLAHLAGEQEVKVRDVARALVERRGGATEPVG